MKSLFTALLVIVLGLWMTVVAQTTSFTYQGRLLQNSLPPTADYDMEFKLFDAALDGNELGSLARPNVAVSSGTFTVMLDFGAQFDGSPRFLEISVKAAGSPDPLTLLSPRQPISSTPYAIRTLNADAAEMAVNADQLGGVDASQYVQTSDSRLTNARMPTAGSSFYVQNGTSQQSGSNFNITGSGKANVFDAATQYNIAGTRVLGTSSLNTYVGVSSGSSNTIGVGNTFLGRTAGRDNTEGTSNTFTGSESGLRNTEGFNNTFSGSASGRDNLTGNFNSFFGSSSGTNNVTGLGNSFFGNASGFNNESGSQNVFLGSSTGFDNVSGSNNTLLGSNASLAAADLTYATAIGSGAIVGTSNTIIIGRQTGTDRVRIFGILPVGGVSAPICTDNSGFLAYCLGGSSSFQEQKALIDRQQARIEEQEKAHRELEERFERQRKQIDELRDIVCTLKPDAGVCKEVKE